MTYNLITFHTTTQALLFETKAKQYHFEGRLIPLPKAVSAGCGLCFSAKNIEEAERFIHEHQLIYDKICEVTF